MIRVLLGSVAVALGVCAAAAQQDAARKAAMRDIDKHVQALDAMTNGTAQFDLSTAQGDITSLALATIKAKALFAHDAQTDPTAIDPRILQNMADFNAKFVKLLTDAKIDLVGDLGGLKTTVSNISKDCSACHDLYLTKKN